MFSLSLFIFCTVSPAVEPLSEYKQQNKAHSIKTEPESKKINMKHIYVAVVGIVTALSLQLYADSI